MKRLLIALFSFFFNNVFFNNIVIFLGLEKKIKKYYNPYIKFKPNRKKSLQETAGFSIRPEINEILEKIHRKLSQTTTTSFPFGGNVLDIGCGPGLYLKDFNEQYKLFATDINSEMLELAAKEVPAAKFYHGDFMKIKLDEKYHMIYSIGMLIYIGRNDIELFFEKIGELLLPGGIFFLSYPHAISRLDLYYPDLSYIQYSPAFIQKLVSGKFNLIEHHHAFDGRIIEKYDPYPYASTNPHVSRTYKNSSILILQKKG